MSGKAKTKNNITVSNGDFMTYTLGSVVINEKKVTLTVADDLIFDLGDIVGSPTRSVLKSMLTGEIFKESYSDTDGVKPLGINGNAVYLGSIAPQMSFGNDWKWLFKKESEVLIAGGEGVTKNNAFCSRS